MRKIVINIALALLPMAVFSQGARQEISQDIYKSGSNYYAYPGPTQSKLTKAPKGKKPFYISHYGRHGSRYLINEGDYDNAWRTLTRADSLGKLTDYGKDVLSRVARLRDEAHNRLGELTLRGAQQHRGIARRMMERFPEVFKGKTNIDARSTTVIRCILSMENALQEMVSMNNKLVVSHDASQHDMWYMNRGVRRLSQNRMPEPVQKAYDDFCSRHEHHDRLMLRIFNDENYWKNEVNASQLNYQLFKLASNVQSTELRHELSLYDLFNEQEIYENWLQTNAWWYINYGPYPGNGGEQPFREASLLKKMITDADSCLNFAHPGATLRYGHEVCVLPLACLMELDDCGKRIADLEQVADQGWRCYDIFPMACNVQIVFYRKNPSDKDVLIKVLLNENETRLPLPSDQHPYYRWSDFRDYFLKKIEAFEKEN